MGAPLRYARECGPIALSALTDLEPAEAAERLWGHRALWMDRAGRYPSASGVLGTPPEAMADVLIRSGHGIDWWSGTGELIASAEIYPKHLAREAQKRATEVRRIIPPGRELDTGDGADPESGPDWPTLSEWLELHPGGGRWLVCCFEGAKAHVLASFGSSILAGGPVEVYQDWKVYRALRVFPMNGG